MRFSHNGRIYPVTGWSGVTQSSLGTVRRQSDFSSALGSALASQFGGGNPVSGAFMSLGSSQGLIGDMGSSGHTIAFDIVDDGRRFADSPTPADRAYIAEKVARAFAATIGQNFNGADLVAAARSGGSSGEFRFNGLDVTYAPRAGSTPAPIPAPPAPTPTPTVPSPPPPPAPAPISATDQSATRPVAPTPTLPPFPAPAPAAATESQRAAARELATFVAAAAPGLLVNASSRAVFNSTVERLQRDMGGISVDGLYGTQTRTRMEALGVSAPLPRAPNATPTRTVTENDQRVLPPSQASTLFGGRLSTGVVAAVAVGVIVVGAAVAYATQGPSARAPALPARSSRPAGRRSGR
jgi:hypothetical protein